MIYLHWLSFKEKISIGILEQGQTAKVILKYLASRRMTSTQSAIVVASYSHGPSIRIQEGSLRVVLWTLEEDAAQVDTLDDADEVDFESAKKKSQLVALFVIW